MANKQLGTRHDEKLIEAATNKANTLGLSFNQYINNALEFYTKLDTKFIENLHAKAMYLKFSPADLVQRIFADWIAKVDASIEVVGIYSDISRDTITTGSYEKDYKMLRDLHVRELEQMIVTAAFKKESRGISLNEFEKKLLIKYRIDGSKTWLESEEYKREQEIKAEIERFMQKNNMEGPEE